MTCKANFIISDLRGLTYRVSGYYWDDGAYWCESPDTKSEGLYVSRGVEWEDDPTRLLRATAPPVVEENLQIVSKYRILRVMLDPKPGKRTVARKSNAVHTTERS